MPVETDACRKFGDDLVALMRFLTEWDRPLQPDIGSGYPASDYAAYLAEIVLCRAVDGCVFRRDALI